ncbi:transposase DNA-binding-containing protein, partial [Prevotella jejuni]
MQLNNIFDSLGGDKRVERRVNSLFDKMVEKQSAVINKCFEDKAPKVGAYRVLRNKNW